MGSQTAAVTKGDKPHTELVDMNIGEVSVVDRGANGKKLLLVKAAGETAAPGDAAAVETPEANPEPTSPEPGAVDAGSAGSGVEGQTPGDPLDDVEKRGAKISAERKAKLIAARDILSAILEDAADAAAAEQAAEEMDVGKALADAVAELREHVSAEVAKATATISDLAKRVDAAEASSNEVRQAVAKAATTTTARASRPIEGPPAAPASAQTVRWDRDMGKDPASSSRPVRRA